MAGRLPLDSGELLLVSKGPKAVSRELRIFSGVSVRLERVSRSMDMASGGPTLVKTRSAIVFINKNNPRKKIPTKKCTYHEKEPLYKYFHKYKKLYSHKPVDEKFQCVR